MADQWWDSQESPLYEICGKDKLAHWDIQLFCPIYATYRPAKATPEAT